MNINDILLMRHELLLVIAASVLLIFEIFTSDKQKKAVLPLALCLMAITMVVGLVAPAEGKIFGGMYQTDLLRNSMKLVLDLGTILVMLMSAGWIKKSENIDKVSEFFIIIISTLIGMNFMISSGDFLMLYLGLELATIPLTALAAFDRYKKISAEAGIKYILSSALSSGILLFGLSMVYGTVGSVYFPAVQAAINPKDALTMLGMVFFIAGMGFKISLVPFHLWTADVYEGSPIPVTAYLSVVSKGSAAFVFTWVLYNVFGQSAEIWRQLLVTLSILTMTIGNLFALRQENMKRFLAFSSIAQAGFIILAILGQSAIGMASVVYFLLVYVFTNIAAFTVVASIADKTGKEQMSDYNGLYQTNPKLVLILMLALFSLAGIPPVAGFFSKLFLFNAAASQGYYWLIFIAVINATISLYYYLRPVRAMFIEKNDNPIAYFKSDSYVRIGLIICVAGIFLTGFMSAIFEYLVSISNF
jgi:NADH-quinone oxidoreductase subunit N